MENKGLLFIPDISGFTKFVNDVEVEHSRFIIQDLLEILIRENRIGLEISEIEGDAILFYKYGEPPDLQKLYEQVKQMFCAFHRQLLSYEYRRICQCRACVSAVGLTLKVITHYGEFTGYHVRNFNKLIGKDIIIAHQLLKNDIRHHEYWLVTKSLSPDKPQADPAQGMEWSNGARKTESGEIAFHYTQLSPLKKKVEPDPLRPELLNKFKVLSVSREYETPVKVLFYTTVHLEFRHRWQAGVKSMEEIDHIIPGIGSRHRCVRENGETTMYFSSFSYDPEKRIIFSETEEKGRNALYYILEKTGNGKSRLTLEFYLKKDPVQQLLFRLSGKRKMNTALQQSLLDLEALVKEIELPVEF